MKTTCRAQTLGLDLVDHSLVDFLYPSLVIIDQAQSPLEHYSQCIQSILSASFSLVLLVAELVTGVNLRILLMTRRPGELGVRIDYRITFPGTRASSSGRLVHVYEVSSVHTVTPSEPMKLLFLIKLMRSPQLMIETLLSTFSLLRALRLALGPCARTDSTSTRVRFTIISRTFWEVPTASTLLLRLKVL